MSPTVAAILFLILGIWALVEVAHFGLGLYIRHLDRRTCRAEDQTRALVRQAGMDEGFPWDNIR